LAVVRQCVLEGRYRLTLHAETERDDDRIFTSDLEAALCSARAEVIEDYPDDARGASFLMLGFTRADDPIHAVCALGGELVIITVYRPDPHRWINWRSRRGV
jgi:hypothetical protein